MARTRGLALITLASFLLLPGTAVAGVAAGDSAVGSGWRLTDGTPRVSFELDARSAADGTNARGTYSFSFPDLEVWFTGEVTCLRVAGHDAVVGGRITDSQNVGDAQGFEVWLIDGGVPAGGQPGPDLISTTLVLADSPTTCPSFELPSSEAWRSVKGSLAVTDR